MLDHAFEGALTVDSWSIRSQHSYEVSVIPRKVKCVQNGSSADVAQTCSSKAKIKTGAHVQTEIQPKEANE